MRNYRQGDGEGWLALVRAAPDFPYAFFNRSPSLDALCMVVAHPHMDAAHNLLFVECIDQLVGYAELWRAAGRERSTGRVLVHPDWRRHGLGSALLARIEEQARLERGRHLHIQAAQFPVAQRFLAAHGFAPVHYSWQMVLADVAAAPLPDWPAGAARAVSCLAVTSRRRSNWRTHPSRASGNTCP